MGNLRSFEIDLARFAREDVPEALGVLMRAISMQALSGVVLKSPVDTGRFRGNWQTSVGMEIGEAIDREDKGGGSTISEGNARIATVTANPFNVVHIQNNLAYAGKLEDGWSQQAPAGMVMLTVAEIEGQFA